MKRIFAFLLFLAASAALKASDYIGLSLVPPHSVTTCVDVDVRGGIRNESAAKARYHLTFYLDGESRCNILLDTLLTLAPGESGRAKFSFETSGKAGKHRIVLKARKGSRVYRESEEIEIIDSDIRSTRKIEGAFVGFYHWSEQEGKMWNPVIKNLTDDQWKEVTRSMNKLDMNVVVMQESFRNQAYVGKHSIETEGYKGRAFYDSKLYPSRMPIDSSDPIEAMLSEADKQGMNVFVGVGMYAWFDYTPMSLEWHKSVARELWDKYGHHPSFYGFYVSEEGMGSLDCFEKDPAKKPMRQQQVLNFFREFTPFCRNLAPDKPVMFAPNGWNVGKAKHLYPQLLENVDIICPFAFARMPKNDLTGIEAVGFLQKACDDACAHMWLDLEAFLFDKTAGYLVPRPIDEIKGDLLLFDNFEKVVCYQYPGVFNDPDASVCIGEPSTIELFKQYRDYISSQEFNLENAYLRNYLNDLKCHGGYPSYDEDTLYSSTYMDHIALVDSLPGSRQDVPSYVKLNWKASDKGPYTVTLSCTDHPGSVPRVMKTKDNVLRIFNLIPGESYSYTVQDGVSSTVSGGSFKTDGRRRMLYVPGTRNFRDLGGLETEDGKYRIKYGLLYRTSEIDTITLEGRRIMKDDLGVGLDMDLRYLNETKGVNGSVLGNGVKYARIQVGAINKLDKNGNYGKVFSEICKSVSEGRPVFCHCVSGADRTGAVALLLCGVLGVSESDCVSDYELTSFSVGERWRYRSGTRSIPYDKANNWHGKMADAMKVIYGYRKTPQDSFKDMVTNYLVEAQGVSHETIEEFRNIMLEKRK